MSDDNYDALERLQNRKGDTGLDTSTSVLPTGANNEVMDIRDPAQRAVVAADAINSTFHKQEIINLIGYVDAIEPELEALRKATAQGEKAKLKGTDALAAENVKLRTRLSNYEAVGDTVD